MKIQTGFTLIELVITIIILGILAATAVPKFVDLRDDAKTAAHQGIIGAIASANSANYSARSANNTKGFATQGATCSAAINAILPSGLPTGYDFGNPTDVIAPSKVTSCVITQTDGTATPPALSVTIIGIP